MAFVPWVILCLILWSCCVIGIIFMTGSCGSEDLTKLFSHLKLCHYYHSYEIIRFQFGLKARAVKCSAPIVAIGMLELTISLRFNATIE